MKLIWIAASLLLGAAAIAAPQDPAVLSVDVSRVNVVFTVADKNGRFVTNLKRDSFKVFEDNRPQSVTNFSSEADLPIAVALLLDVSSSVHSILAAEQQSAIEFFKATLKPKDRGAVIAFDSRAEMVQDFTGNQEALSKAVKSISTCPCNTAVYDAVYLAATEKLSREQGRRAVVLISDGADSNSRITFAKMLEAAQQNEVAIYAISNIIGSPSDEQKSGKAILQKMADESGGRAFFPKTVEELALKLRDVGEELRSQYTIAYQSNNPRTDGLFRKFRVDVSDKEFKVRTSRSGYTPPKPN